MESLRNFLTGPRLFIVIAACALPFVFLGTSSLSSVFGGSLGTINGETVSELDFQVASNSTVQKFKNIYGNDFEFTDLDEEFQIEQIKQELIVQKVFLSEAKSLGLHDKNAEKEAKKSIIRNPIFQIDGVFSENIFEAQANSNGFTKESYIKMLTNMMASEMYRNSISSSGFSTSQEVKEITSLLEQTVGFDFIKIDRKSLLQSIENTNEEKLDFYNENEFLFYSKEKRSFKYIVLTPESYKDKVQIPEGYLESAYDEYLQRENSNTQTRFAHIMIDKANHESNEKAFDFISNIKEKEIDLIRILVDKLDPERSITYESWRNVGLLLNGISRRKEMLDIWKSFSRKASNYDEKGCDDKWKDWKKNTRKDNAQGGLNYLMGL